MTAESAEGKRSASHKGRRAIIGGAVSLGVFVLARIAAEFLYPIGAYPFANQLIFLGTPFLLFAFTVPGVSSMGVAGATATNAVSWIIIGAILGLTIRRGFMVVVVWLLVAGGLAAIAFAGLILGMMSGSP